MGVREKIWSSNKGKRKGLAHSHGGGGGGGFKSVGVFSAYPMKEKTTGGRKPVAAGTQLAAEIVRGEKKWGLTGESIKKFRVFTKPRKTSRGGGWGGGGKGG